MAIHYSTGRPQGVQPTVEAVIQYLAEFDLRTKISIQLGTILNKAFFKTLYLLKAN